MTAALDMSEKSRAASSWTLAASQSASAEALAHTIRRASMSKTQSGARIHPKRGRSVMCRRSARLSTAHLEASAASRSATHASTLGRCLTANNHAKGRERFFSNRTRLTLAQW